MPQRNMPREHERAALRDVAIGPPFDLATMPGIPAAVVKPRTLVEAYGLRNTWRTTETTAFFPAEVLVQLYELLGDVRVVMSALAVATELLLVAAILAGILILMRLYRQRFAVLRALGASRGYIFAVVWTFSFVLIAAGSLLGLAIAAGLTGIVSRHLREGERHRARSADRRTGAHARGRHRRRSARSRAWFRPPCSTASRSSMRCATPDAAGRVAYPRHKS